MGWPLPLRVDSYQVRRVVVSWERQTHFLNTLALKCFFPSTLGRNKLVREYFRQVMGGETLPRAHEGLHLAR